MIKEEQREAPRVVINREFESIDAFLSEYVTNISEKGVFIRTLDPLPIGTKVDLKFSIILDEVEGIEGIGEVIRRCESPADEAGMGVVFTELTSFSEQVIRRLLTRRPE
jgi:Tfp pilus assembly protein PilZ